MALVRAPARAALGRAAPQREQEGAHRDDDGDRDQHDREDSAANGRADHADEEEHSGDQVNPHRLSDYPRVPVMNRCRVVEALWRATTTTPRSGTTPSSGTATAPHSSHAKARSNGAVCRDLTPAARSAACSIVSVAAHV